MHCEAITCVCTLLLVTKLSQVSGAPLAKALGLPEQDSVQQSADNTRSKRSLHAHHSTGTKFTLELNPNHAPAAFESPLEMDEAESSRKRREVASTNDEALAQELISFGSEGDNPHQRRHRRSAAWWLHAAIQLCNNHQAYCRQIQVEEDDIKFTIRLSDS